MIGPDPISATIGALGTFAGIAEKLIANSGCGQTCRTASQIANAGGSAEQELAKEYFAVPAPRSVALRDYVATQALQIHDWMLNNLNNPALGDAGQRGYAERVRGGKYGQFYADIYDRILADPVAIDGNTSTMTQIQREDQLYQYVPTASLQQGAGVGANSGGGPAVAAPNPASGPSLPNNNYTTILLAGIGGVILWQFFKG